jgi:oligoribonuclease
MADASRDLLLWLDMEMTGLEPATCVPLQVALVLTSADLTELDSMELTIWQPESKLETIEPFVRKMHTDNGLLQKVRESDVAMLDAERKMLQFTARHFKAQEAVLCGNSIHQDRRFLTAYFRAFEGYLHYRMIDVSALKELTRRWYGPECVFTKPSSAHTALADARESIEELRHYRRMVMRPASDAARGPG